MKRGWYIVLLAVLLVGCGTRMERKQKRAELQTAELVGALERNVPIDTIRSIAERDDEVLFYIFDARQMVYWSSNKLVSDAVYLNAYDQWKELTFSNAQAQTRWTKAGRYNILTVIPEHYTMPENATQETSPSSNTSRPYFYSIIALFTLLIIVGFIGLIRRRGIRNMRLSTRILYIIFTCVIGVFIYIFVMSVRYVYGGYEFRQRKDLQTRSEYIQAFMRSLYYWDMSLTSAQAQGLEIDLHDLAYDMNQDIHVYSLSGELLASSSPALFEKGLLSRRMAPEAFFTEEHTAVCYEQLGTQRYLVSYVPFHNGSFVTIGYIAVPSFLSEQTRNAELDALMARLLPPYLIVLVLALFFSYWAAQSISAPISMLNEKMRHFEIGSKNNHIDYPYHDELGALVERYNLLIDRVEESAEKLANAEREGAWRTMARQIAHEINNPLTPMKLSVQKLQLKRGTDQFDAYFDKTTRMLISEIDNLAHIAQSFSAFAKQPEVVTTEVDIAAKLSNVITLQRANDEQIPVRYVGPDTGVMALADQDQISQVFVNIIKNAIQASPEDIIVMLNAMYSEREIQISISDNGPGIPEDLREKIFRPNFTTKSNGNGLGLAISKHIVESSGGHITFDTSDKGTTFYITLKKALG
ncbi:MAG: HAMP domain-containing histidine kinase [Paludibacteraceae bacterium]|nr:HAMP domain-containing histidine kinase [Paludibacteraceae bacterium]